MQQRPPAPRRWTIPTHPLLNAEPRSTARSLPSSIADLRGAVLGQVIAPDDSDYESARMVVNAAVDRRPRLIVRRRTMAAGLDDGSRAPPS